MNKEVLKSREWVVFLEKSGYKKLTIVGELNKGFSEMSLAELFVCLFFHLALEQKLKRITDKATICVLKTTI